MVKNSTLIKRIFFLLMLFIVLYVLLPCISYAQSSSAYMPPPNTKTITYFYQGNTLINAEDNNGYMSSYLGNKVRTLVDTNNNTYCINFLISDGKNVVAETSSEGSDVEDIYRYTPYGKPTTYNQTQQVKVKDVSNGLNLSVNPYRYDGYYYDTESGLYYLNARYYSPELMQFISRDTYDLANRYAYCDGNPIGNVDPSGHLPSFMDWFDPIVLNENGSIDTSTTAVFEDLLNIVTQTTDILDLGESEYAIELEKIAENVSIKANKIEEDTSKEKEIFNYLDMMNNQMVKTSKISNQISTKNTQTLIQNNINTERANIQEISLNDLHEFKNDEKNNIQNPLSELTKQLGESREKSGDLSKFNLNGQLMLKGLIGKYDSKNAASIFSYTTHMTTSPELANYYARAGLNKDEQGIVFVFKPSEQTLKDNLSTKPKWITLHQNDGDTEIIWKMRREDLIGFYKT